MPGAGGADGDCWAPITGRAAARAEMNVALPTPRGGLCHIHLGYQVAAVRPPAARLIAS
jgi:hypothetical protein